jgi:Cof subfamily protein (haloacid dehalogenase superfamily)
MKGSLVRQIVDYARDLFDECLVSCEILDKWYTDRVEQTFTTETGRMFKPDVIGDLDLCCAQPVTKLMLLGEPRIISRLENEVATKFGEKVSVIRTDEDLIQIMDNRVSKAVALEKVAEHYAVPLDQVMAVGDAPNDVGMLQIAGISVAMDNAHPLVKAVADWVAPSNNDHGVHAALKKYGLCE